MNGTELGFFPKFTSLAGGATGAGQDFFSPVFEVVPFRTVLVEATLLGVIGIGAAVKVQLQSGSDLDFTSWVDVGSEETLSSTPAQVSVTGPLRFVRLRVNLSFASGSAMAATFWAVGVAREA